MNELTQEFDKKTQDASYLADKERKRPKLVQEFTGSWE